jgi:MYXO-CTERM domain-containing protein
MVEIAMIAREATMRRALMIGMLVGAAGFAASVEAGIITSFEGALQEGTPATGWSYLWNGSGDIGTAANYTALLATPPPHSSTDPDWYDSDGVSGLPDPNKDDPTKSGYGAGYVFFGKDTSKGLAQGHPGRAHNQFVGGPDHPYNQTYLGLTTYAIAGYTLGVGEAGHIELTNSRLMAEDASSPDFDGLQLAVYVGDVLQLTKSLTGFKGSNIDFDVDLGSLDVGDTIYVAVGPGSNDYSDAFSLQYSIENLTPSQAPEPGTGLLATLGLLVGAAARRRRKAAQKRSLAG